jgi:predicted DCC family thiol-disulfide oxidoreductase YuxK
MNDLREDAMVVLYDRDCGFCKVTLALLLRWDRAHRLGAVPIQSTLGERLLGDMPSGDRLRSWHLIDGAGALHSGGAAIPVVLAALPRGGPLARVASRFPGPTSRTYEWVAAHRTLLGRLLGTRSRAWAARVIASADGPASDRLGYGTERSSIT